MRFILWLLFWMLAWNFGAWLFALHPVIGIVYAFGAFTVFWPSVEIMLDTTDYSQKETNDRE